LGLANGLEFYRRELERQRDLLQSVWLWYLGPLIPGPVVLMVAKVRIYPGQLRLFGLNLGAFTLFFVLVWMLNQRGARRLQSRIDELDSLGRRP
jgi:hypothetical protein